MNKPIPSRPRPTAVPVKPTMGAQKKAVPGVPTPNRNLPTPRTAQAPAKRAPDAKAAALKNYLLGQKRGK